MRDDRQHERVGQRVVNDFEGAALIVPDDRASEDEQLRATLAYINSVRADSYATGEQKVSDIASLDDIHLRQETIISILGLPDARWQEVQQEAISADAAATQQSTTPQQQPAQ